MENLNKITRKEVDKITNSIYGKYNFSEELEETYSSQKEIMVSDISRTLNLVKELSPYDGFIIEDENQLFDNMPVYLLKVSFYIELLEEFKEEYRENYLNQTRFKTISKWETRHINRFNKIEKVEKTNKRRRI